MNNEEIYSEEWERPLQVDWRQVLRASVGGPQIVEDLLMNCDVCLANLQGKIVLLIWFTSCESIMHTEWSYWENVKGEWFHILCISLFGYLKLEWKHHPSVYQGKKMHKVVQFSVCQAVWLLYDIYRNFQLWTCSIIIFIYFFSVSFCK